MPRLLRQAGLRLITLSEHYGVPADQFVSDVEWLELAGKNNWIVFMKDRRIRRNVHERALVQHYRLRCFCITDASLSAEEMVERFLNNLPAIAELCESTGPYIYGVYRDQMRQLPLT